LEARLLPMFLNTDVPGWRRCDPEPIQDDPPDLHGERTGDEEVVDYFLLEITEMAHCQSCKTMAS